MSDLLSKITERVRRNPLLNFIQTPIVWGHLTVATFFLLWMKGRIPLPFFLLITAPWAVVDVVCLYFLWDINRSNK